MDKKQGYGKYWIYVEIRQVVECIRVTRKVFGLKLKYVLDGDVHSIYS